MCDYFISVTNSHHSRILFSSILHFNLLRAFCYSFHQPVRPNSFSGPRRQQKAGQCWDGPISEWSPGWTPWGPNRAAGRTTGQDSRTMGKCIGVMHWVEWVEDGGSTHLNHPKKPSIKQNWQLVRLKAGGVSEGSWETTSLICSMTQSLRGAPSMIGWTSFVFNILD